MPTIVGAGAARSVSDQVQFRPLCAAGVPVLVRNRAAADRSRGDNGRVLQMRLARPSDKASVARVVGARCDWMEARGLPSWRGAADDLVAQCENPESDVWVLDDEAAGVIGQTVVQEQGPPTTLFLLHWYLASAAGRLDAAAGWTRLSYATRPSARLFCQRLVGSPLPQGETVPSAWITDQAWYLHGWQSDPTIQAMLVMVDAIHREIQRLHPGLDARAAWERLTSTESPAVSFYLLPLDDMESDEDLYITMNSRGKPLTPFETFKARFEQDIQHSDRAGDFAHKIDGAWSDLLWPFHGGDNIVDDELIRYIDFITELCELREGRVVSGRLGPRARAVFGKENERAEEHIAFLFDAFDQWQDHERISRTFSAVLSTSLPGEQRYTPEKVVLFGAASINLFEQCLHNRELRRQRGSVALPAD